MHSVQMGPWDPRPPSKDATPPLFDSRGSRVTSAAPAKRITFYRSGDSQFGGVRMAIHKRSFKCFDALLDDLSQKVPLPFGVRTVTTPRGTHTIEHLEQLQDGGCYLCSDRRQAKPINMELASKRQGAWYHHSRRPQRPESSSVTPPGHLHPLHRQRRILLVRNSEPGTRRSIVLSRRSTRSLKAFLDEASEVMQFHVRRLYTVEGRRIDNVQSLTTCPAVLVCVGHETFSPALLNLIRKTSEEKLPGLGSRSPGLGPRVPGNGARSPSTQGARSPPRRDQSRASEYDEGQKNNNFGLETKKSIIHPRSDSSNRSTRFSMSSEKSYGVGSQARPAIMNDDIEKRVLVNKDGSLSVEMRVRFRLQNDETIQWSTQIKKSPSLMNDCCPLGQQYLQQSQSESCSDPDSTSYEGVDYSKCAENHCPCCYQRQNNQFDLWEISTNKHRPVPPMHASNHTTMRHARSTSSSSSCNSRRMVRCRARLSGSPGGSEQSQFVQKEMSVTEQVEHSIEVDRDGVEVCKVSRCCSRTEVVTVDADLLPPSRKAVEGELTMGQDENRPLSAVSSSSRVLQSLKEDQDDDDDDLPPSASQCSDRTEPIPAGHLDEEPTSNISANSVHSIKHNGHKQNNETESRVSFTASMCHCGAATPHSAADTDEPDRAPSSRSNISKPRSEVEEAADVEVKDVNRATCGSLSRHTGRSASTPKSWTSDVCPNCGGWKCVINSPHVLILSNKENGNNCCDDVASVHSQKISPTNNGSISAEPNNLEGRAPSVMSTASNPNSKGKDEGRAPSSTSATSHRSNMSHKSNCNGVSGVTAEKDKERSSSAMSAQSNLSAMSRKSKCTAEAGEERTASLLSKKSSSSFKFPKTDCPSSAKEALLSDTEEGDADKRAPSLLSVRSNASAKSGKAESLLSNKSTKSNVSAKSGTPDGSIYNQNVKTVSDKPTEGAKVEERSTSVVSVKSNASHKSTKTSERPRSPRSETEEDVDKRSTSQILKEKASSPSLKMAENAEESEDKNIEEETKSRPGSIASINSKNDKKAASVRSGKSAKSHCTNTEVDRSPSATSGRSFAKSSKSHRSNQTKISLHQCDIDITTTEMNGDETENRKDLECVLSVTSGASHKSNSTRNLTSPNIAIIKTPEGPDEEKTDKKEQVSDLLHDLNNKTVDIAVIETNGESCGQTLSPRRQPSSRTRSPKTASPKQSQPQQLLPKPNGGEQKLGRSRCCCGAASAPEKGNKEKEEDEEDRNYDEATSILSSSSKRQRKESDGTEISPSCNSSGSISLGLQEDQDMEGSDNGKSGVSFQKSPEKSSVIEDAKRSGSTVSDGKKEIILAHPPVVDIPTIKTNKGGEGEVEEGVEQTTKRAASASTVKSNRPHKSHCNCSVKAAAQTLDGNVEETKSVKSTSTTNASKTDTQRKSSSRAGVKNAMKETANTDTKNQDTKTSEKEAVVQNEARSICSQSPSSLRPESTASAQQRKATHESVNSGFNPVKSHKTKSQSGSKGGSPCPLHNPRPSSKSEAGSESSVSAGDQLRETKPVACRHSKSSKTSDKPQSEKSAKSPKSRNLKDQEDAVELTLECLPNKSPNEVVSDWLQSIPANSGMLTFDHELNEEDDDQKAKQMVETPGEEIGATEVSPDEEQENNDENAEEDKVHKDDRDAEGPTLGNSARTSSHAKNWQYSAAVMKVLLSSSLGRCQSMPEVSPVYGRRLSTSARGLLDCLAQLQLIEPAVGCNSHQQKERKQQYDEVMAILQSLWLHEPRDIEARETKDNRGSKQVTPPRSSSGVGMSSGSDGSGKGNGNQGEDEMCAKEKEAAEKEDKNGNARDKDTEMEHEETFKADASRKSEDQSTVPQSRESPKTTENTSSSGKNSASDSFKYPTDNERETQEDVHSGATRAPLSKRLSQDPDPVWVLQLLKKLEKQFMSHYIQAMAEFKVRWDLDDNLVLDAMISELRDEVSRRIQSSIQREMKKIQSRAGKGGKWPRPPQLASISRDSTMTEKRRRIMKVIKNQSVKTADSVSDEEMTGSDQRSDDDYCPCDACVRKKMAARPLKKNPLAAECPVIMEFDLRKILQLKKSPAPTPVAVPRPTEEEDEEARNLERVEEEDEEETKADTKTDVNLEETISEENEEEELEKNKREERKVENIMEDEEKDEGEASERDETSENGEEEEEEEGGCTCPSAKDEEESSREEEETSNCTDDETREETGEEEEEEEESDKETVKEATAGKEPTLVEEAVEENVSVEAEDEDDEDDGTEDEESDDEETGSESEDEETSEEERATPQSQAGIPAGTEGEEADAEDSDDSKLDTATEESGREEAGGSGDEEDGDEEEFKHEDKSEEKDEALQHQFTRTSVESQPGSMEDGDADLTSNPVDSTKALKAADGVPARR